MRIETPATIEGLRHANAWILKLLQKERQRNLDLKRRIDILRGKKQ